jgi:hypothetical protein
MSDHDHNARHDAAKSTAPSGSAYADSDKRGKAAVGAHGVPTERMPAPEGFNSQVLDPADLTTAEQETVDTLYAELKPQAIAGAREYVTARTPVPLQAAMAAKIDVDFPPPPEADATRAQSGSYAAGQATKHGHGR